MPQLILSQLILYAYPVGPLADQIEAYYAQSLEAFGPNRAHAYMPHCTLTGFFTDKAVSISLYVDAAAQAMAQSPSTPITIDQLHLKPDWHGLSLTAPALEQLAATFAKQADSPTRQEPIRVKTHLHLSLAYGFPKEQHEPLAQLAEQSVDPTKPVRWQLRFYERHPSGDWTCHFQTPLKTDI
ncbi:MAG: hypothetical protein AAFR99_07530 [Cyanobacteria bacterium J06629_9]